MLFALATLAVIGVIAVLFIGNFRQSQRDSIVLPDAAQSAQPAAQQPAREAARQAGQRVFLKQFLELHSAPPPLFLLSYSALFALIIS